MSELSLSDEYMEGNSGESCLFCYFFLHEVGLKDVCVPDSSRLLRSHCHAAFRSKRLRLVPYEGFLLVERGGSTEEEPKFISIALALNLFSLCPQSLFFLMT